MVVIEAHCGYYRRREALFGSESDPKVNRKYIAFAFDLAINVIAMDVRRSRRSLLRATSDPRQHAQWRLRNRAFFDVSGPLLTAACNAYCKYLPIRTHKKAKSNFRARAPRRYWRLQLLLLSTTMRRVCHR
jgi:hypothetical protein